MKTKLLVLLFFMSVFYTDVFSQAGTGKIGINTTAPTKTLDIKGDLRVRMIRDTSGNLKQLAVDDSGNVYKVIGSNSISDTCPTGFVSVNNEYCIEPNERTATTWWNAIQICGSLNAHLCEIYEWYFAALNGPSLGMTNLTGNWEWIGDTAGAGTVRYVGLTSIKDIATAVPYDTVYYEFRCCKSK